MHRMNASLPVLAKEHLAAALHCVVTHIVLYIPQYVIMHDIYHMYIPQYVLCQEYFVQTALLLERNLIDSV